jgi:hypothetical protein
VTPEVPVTSQKLSRRLGLGTGEEETSNKKGSGDASGDQSRPETVTGLPSLLFVFVSNFFFFHFLVLLSDPGASLRLPLPFNLGAGSFRNLCGM